MPRMRKERWPAARLLVSAKRHPLALHAITLFGWVVLLGLAQAPQPVLLCLSPSAFRAAAAGGLEAMLLISPPWTLALSWLAMLLAMMTPLLGRPLRLLRSRSPSDRRARAVALFVAGYGAIWLAAGAVLTTMAIALSIGAGAPAGPPFAAAALIALAWQATPFKQACLGRCHRPPRVSSSGLEADALRYGITHGLWCVGACWALMLLPLLAGSAHLAAMAAVTAVLWIERARPARPARWGFALPFRRTLPAFWKPAIMRSSP